MLVAEPQRIDKLTDENTRENGVRCPKCHCRHCPAIGGMIRHFANATRKKRQCRYCGCQFWTLEQIVGE